MAEAFSATCPLLKASNLILRWSTQGLVHVPCWWYWTSLNITFKWFWPRHRPCVISAGETGCAWIEWFQWNAALSNLDQWWSIESIVFMGFQWWSDHSMGFEMFSNPTMTDSVAPFPCWIDQLGRWSMDRPNETSLMLKPIIGSSNPMVFLDEIMKSRVVR